MKIVEDFIFDPSLALYLPLYELDGASFMSRDAYGHLCTATGALWRPDGRYFDGSDDYLNINAVRASLASTTTGTMIAWISLSDATPSADNSVINFGDTSALEYITSYIKATTGVFVFEARKEGAIQFTLVTDSSEFSDNTWAMVALAQDGSSPIININGVEPSQTLADQTDKTSWFADLTGLDNGRIGTLNMNNLGEISDFGGGIGEVWIYNRALTPLEIQHNYLVTKWRYQ